MQPIQDKDFDNLFKNAFEDAEIAPSKDLWSNIESEIEPKKKSVFPIYWLSAAAILLFATIGLLVYKQQEVKPKQFANIVEPKAVKPVIVTPPDKDATVVVVAPIENTAASKLSTKPAALAKNKATEATAKPVEKHKIITAPEMQKQEIMIAQVKEPEQDIKQKIDAAILEQDKTVLASNPSLLKADEVIGENIQTENKGIRNVGDVVNLIVNTVDKRKDKFIQFRTDDDDSSLSSINIGPIKFGKRKK